MTSASSSPENSWLQALEENPQNDAANKYFGGVVEQVAVKLDKPFEDLEDRLLNEDAFVLMVMKSGGATTAKRGGGSGLSFLHHLGKLEPAGDKKDDDDDAPPIYVALEGLEADAKPVEIALKKGTEKIEIVAPAWEALKAMDSKESSMFSAAKTSKYFVRPIQLLPPFLHTALLLKSTNESYRNSPADLLGEALRAIKSFDIKHALDKDSSYDKADVFCRGIVAFLWNAAMKDNKGTPMDVDVKASEAPHVLEWCKKLHEEHVETLHSSDEHAAGEGKGQTAGKFDDAASENPTDDKWAAILRNTNDPQRFLTGRKMRTWEENFDRVVAYQKEVGDCNVPREYAKDKALGEWVKNQRSVSKTLPQKRRTRLEDIGFTFSNTQQDRSNNNWEEKYVKLKAFADANGGSCGKALKEDRSLQHWVTIQRQSHRRGNMDEERKKKLDDIGFVWKVKNDYKPRQKNDVQWQKGYARLLEFHKEHKHCNVPKRPTDCRPLWEWVYSQRKAQSEKRLSADRIELMEELGMVWDTDMGQVIRDQQWNIKYDDAKTFFDAHGHLEVPRRGSFGSTNLLKWLLRQREQYKNDKLCSSRKKLLDDLTFDFEGNNKYRDKLLEEMNWKDRYEELEAYKEETDTIPEKGDTLKEKGIAKWVAKQQVAYQFHDLDPFRKVILDKLGVVFPAQMPEAPMKKKPATPLRTIIRSKPKVPKVAKKSEESKDEEMTAAAAEGNDNEKEAKEVGAIVDDSKTAKEVVAASKSDARKKAKAKEAGAAAKDEASKDTKDPDTTDEPKRAKRKANIEKPKEDVAATEDKNGKDAELKDDGRKRRKRSDRGKSTKEPEAENRPMFI